MIKKNRSFLKWAGSKFNCLNQILDALPEGQRLIEPFLGSGVVFLNTNYPKYLLAEHNSDLVDLFINLKNNGPEFIALCREFFHPKNNLKASYYVKRTQFNQEPSSALKSALFLYLNRHGYNGLCRYNRKGHYNVPFGSFKKPYFPEKEMALFQKKIQNTLILSQDFRQTFKAARPGDVIYCDPPYVQLTGKTGANTYTSLPFTEQDQKDLAECAEHTAKKGIPVLISNHDTSFTRSLYAKAQIKSFPVSRWISCQTKTRLPVHELLAFYRPQEAKD